MTICKDCLAGMSTQEEAAYWDRCENCWVWASGNFYQRSIPVSAFVEWLGAPTLDDGRVVRKELPQ